MLNYKLPYSFTWWQSAGIYESWLFRQSWESWESWKSWGTFAMTWYCVIAKCLFHAFHAICLVSCFMRYALYHASCDMSCIMLHAICLVSCFMRYALYHASCHMSCIMLHAICLVSCFMRYACFMLFMRKACSMRGLGYGAYIEVSAPRRAHQVKYSLGGSINWYWPSYYLLRSDRSILVSFIFSSSNHVRPTT